MNHIFTDETEWLKLKTGITRLAKQEILSRFEKVTAELKADGTLLTEADTEMQRLTKAFLAENWPEFTFLGEESPVEEQKAALNHSQGCWILDPVDGTSNFASGIPFFSVSLALAVEGQMVLGMVYDPSRDELFSARIGQGAQLNDAELKASSVKESLKQCSAIVDFKRLSETLAQSMARKAPYSSQRSFGSVALDWCWIAAGRGQVYCHGSQHLWDYAAGWVILNEAGGYSATLQGEQVMLAEVVKRSAVAATTKSLFDEWMAYIQAHDKA